MDIAPLVTHVSHCYGYGGIDLGLKRVIGRGLRTIAACEIEAFAIWNGLAKSETGQADVDVPFWTNLKTFPFADFHGLVDIYTAGFPCQPFSAAGKRGADEDPRHLFPHIKRGIEQMRPGVVFLENVEGIISAKLAGDGWNDPAGTPVRFHVLRELERVGYRATAGVFSASEVGAPHQRKRVFILAHHHHQGSQGRDGAVLPERSSERVVRSGDSSLADGQGRTGHALQCERENLHDESGVSPSFTLWPSRPGDQQYEWEPPRVVGNNPGNRRGKGRAEHAVRSGRDAATSSSEPSLADAERAERGQNTGGRNVNDRSDGGREEETGGSPQHCGGEGNLANAKRSDEARREPASGEASGGRAHDQLGGSVAHAGQIESALGGSLNGPPGGLDYAELCVSCDSRVDELRLLGNGVLPETVERAFLTLARRFF